MRNQRNRSGFTLVEILIVVIILGILAAIVIPKFTNASSEAKRNTLTSTLHSLRSQIELYMLQHGDKPPVLTGTDWTPLTDQITVGAQTTGPYIMTSPTNPVNGQSGILAVTSDQIGGAAVGAANIGFVYNSKNGKVWGTNTAGNKVFNEIDPSDPNN
ncbi:MAG: putative fimbrial protein [Phycisphaerales bacterium]|nr:putative fimbrial protein [Phycisphaerales bacterium]